MLRLGTVLGRADDPPMAGRLAALARAGRVETVRLSPRDMARRRLQVRTDAGTEAALMLDRDATLRDGDVLWLDGTGAIVVRLQAPDWLTLEAAHAAAALELGHLAGSMHWKVRFDADRLHVMLDGPREGYLARVASLSARGLVRVLETDAVAGDAGPPGRDGDTGHGHDHAHHHVHGDPRGHDHAPDAQAHDPWVAVPDPAARP